ncbi:putative serine/threonine protein phosphatase [Vibrio phage VCPH]|nr:putative serine/threonine protein phosphatase [Vibrio phage VCPH]
MAFVQKLKVNHRGRLFILTDLHGQYSLFLEFLKWARVHEADTLVSCGDLVDRGSGSFQLLTHFLLAHNCHSVLGNHEEFMLHAMLDNDRHAAMNWLYNGGEWHLEVDNSLLYGTAVRVNEEFPIILDLELPNGEFIGISHAGFPFDSRDELFDLDYGNTVTGMTLNTKVQKALWDRRQIKGEDQHIDGYKYVFHGHTVTFAVRPDKEPKPIEKGNQVWMDTGAPFPGGRMTVAEIHRDNGQIQWHQLWFDEHGELCIV